MGFSLRWIDRWILYHQTTREVLRCLLWSCVSHDFKMLLEDRRWCTEIKKCSVFSPATTKALFKRKNFQILQPLQSFSFFFNLFLIGGWLLYNVVLVSAIQQCEAAKSIHRSPSPTPPHPSSLSQSTSLRLSVSSSKLPQAISFTYGSIYVPVLPPQFIPPYSYRLCSQVCSLCLCLYSCPADRFISTIFLDSIYVH